MNIIINLPFEFPRKNYIVFILVLQNLFFWFMIILIINKNLNFKINIYDLWLVLYYIYDYEIYYSLLN